MKLTIHILPICLLLLFACSVEDNNEKADIQTSISISSPENNSIVQDTVLIYCESNNNNIVLKVELWVNGDSTGICDYGPPFILTWDTYSYENGNHTLFIRLYDEEGNIIDSDDVDVMVNNFLTFSSTFGSQDINEVGYSITQRTDSSFIILGGMDNDILLLGTDRYGNVQWHQSFGGSQSDKANHIQQTSDGGYIISGTTRSYGFGGSDVWLIKTGPTGLIEWNSYLGTTNNEHGGQVIEMPDGGFVLIGDRDLLGNGDSDIWLVKTNSVGDSLWTRSYGGPEPEHGYDIILNEDGGFTLLGSTESFGNGGADIWLIKTDANGNEQWNQSYGDASNDIGQSMLRTYDNGYLIKSKIQSFGEGNTAIGLLRVGSNGEPIWTKTFGGSNGDSGYSLRNTNDNEYILACSLFDHGHNAYNAWLIKLNDSGDVTWEKVLGGSEHDQGFSGVQTLDGGYAFVGSTNNFGNGDKNSSDLWIIKTDPVGFIGSLGN